MLGIHLSPSQWPSGSPASSKSSGSSGGANVSESFIDQTQGRLDSLDDQIRDLTGKMEQLTNL